MDNMDVILSLNEYSIYRNDNYYLCVPNIEHRFYHVFIGFSLKDLNNLSHEKRIIEIRKISDSIFTVYKNCVYILPIIEPSFLEEITSENDDRGYNKILKNTIQPITLSVYTMLMKKNSRVSQIIKMIKQNNVDTKLIDWFSLKLGDNFIKEITFEGNEVFTTIPIEVVYDINSHVISEDISIDYQVDSIWIKNEEEKISNSLKPAFSQGFSNMKFIILVLSVASLFGGIITYLILK